MTTPPRTAPPARLASAAALALLLPLPACDGGSASAAGQPAGEGLVIENPSDPERDYFHDFGHIREGEVATHVFELRNADPAPITIQRITPACGCTTPVLTWTDEQGVERRGRTAGDPPVATLPPGALAQLSIGLDSTAVRVKNADKLALVRLMCDSPATPFLTFELHTVVDLDFQATPSTLDLGQVPVGGGASATSVVITAARGAPVGIAGVASASPELTVDIREEDHPSGEHVWNVTVELPPGLPLGPYVGEVVLAATDGDGATPAPPFRIPVRAMVVQDVIVQPPLLSFVPNPDGEGLRAEAEIRCLVPGQRALVELDELDVPAASGVQVSRITPIGPDERGRAARWLLILEAPQPQDATAVHSGAVRLKLDGVEPSALEARFVLRAR